MQYTGSVTSAQIRVCSVHMNRSNLGVCRMHEGVGGGGGGQAQTSPYNSWLWRDRRSIPHPAAAPPVDWTQGLRIRSLMLYHWATPPHPLYRCVSDNHHPQSAATWLLRFCYNKISHKQIWDCNLQKWSPPSMTFSVRGSQGLMRELCSGFCWWHCHDNSLSSQQLWHADSPCRVGSIWCLLTSIPTNSKRFEE